MHWRNLAPAAVLPLALLSGCAGIAFSDRPLPDGLRFYDPVSYLAVTVAPDCTIKSEIVSVPGAERSFRYVRGLGTAKIDLVLTNGMLTSVKAETDSKIPEFTGAVSGAVKTGKGFVEAEDQKVRITPKICPSSLKYYRITQGQIGTEAREFPEAK